MCILLVVMSFIEASLLSKYVFEDCLERKRRDIFHYCYTPSSLVDMYRYCKGDPPLNLQGVTSRKISIFLVRFSYRTLLI